MTKDMVGDATRAADMQIDIVYSVNKQEIDGLERRRRDVSCGKAQELAGIRDEMNYHLQLIVNEYKRRTAKNPRYSLRAYASFLNLDPSALSRILAGKQELSVKSGIAIVKRLQMSSDEGRRFLLSVLDGRRRNEAARVGRFVSAPHLRPNPVAIDPEICSRIANLSCFALLELAFTDDFKSDPEWIALRLGIDVKEVKEMIETLLSVGLLKNEGGRLTNIHSHLMAAKTEEAHQIRWKLQEQVLNGAARSLRKDPPEMRAHYGMTMAIDASKIELASRRIREFLENLNDELSTSPKTEVFHLAVQFFPLSVSTLPSAVHRS